MRGWTRIFRTAGLASAPVWLALLVAPATLHAADDYQRFLDSLRDRGYYDISLEYLARLKQDPTVPEEFKQRIAYEEGTTLITASVAERDAGQKAKHLNAARDKLTEFIKSAQDVSLAAEAESQLGNVLVERAKMLLQRANSPKNAAQKVALTEEARGLFAEAQQVFNSAEKKFADHLKQLPKDGGKTNDSQAARVDLRRARLFAAQATYESSKAYPADSAERKKALEDAAKRFGDLHEKYRSLLFGLLANTYQGHCYLDLGDTKRALGIFNDIVAQPDESEEMQRLKTHAVNLALQALTSDKEKNYEQAAALGTSWASKAVRGTDMRSADWLAIRYLTAVALAKHAATLEKKDEGGRRQALKDARKNAKEAASIPGEYQEAAKKLLQELTGDAEGDDKPAANFAEALDRAKEALDVMQAKLAQIKAAPAANDQANVPTYERESNAAREQARELFRAALSLRDSSVPLEEVNSARYYLCYLAYQGGDYLDAAVLGDFLARRHPTATGARPAAKIALLSLLQTYNTAAPEERDSAQRRMEQLADFMTRRFAGDAEADEAWMTLMIVATNQRNVDQVLGYLARIPEQSPRRAEAELKAGQALWIASLAASRLPEESRPPQAELDKLRGQSQELLARGVDRAKQSVEASSVNYTMAAGALSLSQIFVETNHAEEAVKLLEDPKIGPLALVEAKSPVASEGAFAMEACKVALRAYVATQQLDKAEKAMTQLEANVSAADEAKKSQLLVAIYRALGQELENHVAMLRQENRLADLQAVSRGFDLFLDRIVSKADGNNFKSLNWVAETYSRLAAGHEREDDIPAEARAYYAKAAAADEKILAEIAKDPAFAAPDAALAIKVRMAKSQRRSGNFKESVALLTEVLRKMPMLLDGQREAAYTFQEWGREEPAHFLEAISGGSREKDAKGQEFNVIWGWTRLAALTQRDKRFQSVFHEARFNLAKCWLLSAAKQTGADKAASLKKAESTVLLTLQLHPDLGGGDWPAKYDKLFKMIQKELGQPAIGIPHRKPTDAEKPTASTAAVPK